MRSLAVRRHSLRAPHAAELSPAGIELARRVATLEARYDRAVSSPLPRALATVRAMGLEVDREDPDLGPIDASAEAALGPAVSWAECALAIARRPPVARAAARGARALERAALELEDGERGLVVSHALVVELAVAAAWPAAPFLAWGTTVGCLEGAELRFEGGRVVDGRVLRVPGA